MIRSHFLERYLTGQRRRADPRDRRFTAKWRVGRPIVSYRYATFCPVDSRRRGAGESLSPPGRIGTGRLRKTRCVAMDATFWSRRGKPGQTGQEIEAGEPESLAAGSRRAARGAPDFLNSPNTPIPAQRRSVFRHRRCLPYCSGAEGCPRTQLLMPHWSAYQALHVSADRQIPQALVALGGSRSIRVGLVTQLGQGLFWKTHPPPAYGASGFPPSQPALREE